MPLLKLEHTNIVSTSKNLHYRSKRDSCSMVNLFLYVPSLKIYYHRPCCLKTYKIQYIVQNKKIIHNKLTLDFFPLQYYYLKKEA